MNTPTPSEFRLLQAREQMVEQQIATRGIQDERVLEAMGRVPREAFVPSFLQSAAYEDRPLLIGYDQTISQPYIVALMTESLGLKGGERVLEIGTGSGYQTAVLAELCAEVYSIERHAKLSRRAERTLQRHGYRNVKLRVGNGAKGWPEAAPFDAILVAAGATSLPWAFHQQIRIGGRLVIPLGAPGEQVLHRFTRLSEGWDDEPITRVSFVPFINEGPVS